jgi:hypothetical protein
MENENRLKNEKLCNNAFLFAVVLFTTLTILTVSTNFICAMMNINIKNYSIFIKLTLILKIISSIIIAALYTVKLNYKMTKLFKIKVFIYLLILIGGFLLISYFKTNAWFDFGIIYSIHITTALFVYITIGLTNQLFLKQERKNYNNNQNTNITKDWNTYTK